MMAHKATRTTGRHTNPVQAHPHSAQSSASNQSLALKYLWLATTDEQNDANYRRAIGSSVFQPAIVSSSNCVVSLQHTATGTSWEDARTIQVLHPDDLLNAMQYARSENEYAAIVADIRDSRSWTVIPAENLKAVSDEATASVPVYALVSSANDAIRALTALEGGLDGAILADAPEAEIDTLEEVVVQARDEASSTLTLEPAEVLRVERIGEGERACVDLASSMQPGEGALVGCFAQAQLLVHAECFNTGFVGAREWRVNAGAISQYLLCADNKLPYLSEIRCGMQALVVSGTTGATRREIVARVKVERRQLALVEAQLVRDGSRVSVMVQEAETVRLARTSTVSAISPLQLQAGDHVLAYAGAAGPRHTGIAVSEATFSER